MRFLHAADIHLGNQQYNHDERFNDFYRGFQKVAQCAIDEAVTVCLIAGDLFHKVAIDSFTLIQAEHELQRMQNAGIRVLAVRETTTAYVTDSRTRLHGCSHLRVNVP